MSEPHPIVVDRNYFQRVGRVDPSGELADFIFRTYDCPQVADRGQLQHVTECALNHESFHDHGITDEETALFISQWSASLRKVSRDTVDVKLVLYCRKNPGARMLTCDKGLLRVSGEMGIPRACFKASLHHADRRWDGGLLAEHQLPFERVVEMFETEPTESDPFFHFANCRYCLSCDPNRTCKTHAQPPTRTSTPS